MMLSHDSSVNANQMLCRGHNGKVRSLEWSVNDPYLVSCGTEGVVY